MIDESNHIDTETLSAYADGESNVAMVPRVERHLSECAACRETLRGVRELVAAARGLPRDVAPPPEVWGALRDRVWLDMEL